MSEREAAISIKDLHKRFGAFEVLKGISLEAKKGDVIISVAAARASRLFCAVSTCWKCRPRDRSRSMAKRSR